MDSRIEKIRKTAQKRDEENNRIAEENRKKIEDYTNKITALAPRIAELLDLATELQRNHLPLGKRKARRDWWDEFEAEGINHNLGFRTYKGVLTQEIGIEGGGCCGFDLFVNRYGKITINPIDVIIGTRTIKQATDDFFRKCDAFLSLFDKFESDVNAYIDNL